MTFADGTTVSINSGTLCLVSSFVDNQEKMYSIIHTPEESATNLTVNHTGDSTFEVITPAVIAGVEGTKFTVKNLIDAAKHLTDITVLEGIVYVEDRQRDATEITVKPGDGTFDVTVNLPEEEEHDKDTTPRKRNWVPRKPRKSRR